MRKYNCKAPGCYVVLDEPGYCERHRKFGEQEAMRKATARAARQPWAEANRPNQRLYNTARWRTLRAFIIAKYPYCANCGDTERLQVHHIVPPKGDEQLFYDDGNLVVLCAACHAKVTSQENKR